MHQNFGIPQRKEYHPEIDTGDHVMRVIDIAKTHFDKPLVTWAALLHDLGKGLTPKNEWARHLRHESTGVPLVAEVCQRYKVPKDYHKVNLNTSDSG